MTLSTSSVIHHSKNQENDHQTSVSEQPTSNNGKDTENWELQNQKVTISPSFVDVSKLCDFINGVDNQIDSWLHNDNVNPTLSQEKHSSKDSPGTKISNSKTENIAVDENPLIVKKKEESFERKLDFEETLSDLTEILGKSLQSCSQKQDKKTEELKDIKDSISDSIDDDKDWLEEFENDEFWGQRSKTDIENNAFDLDALDLFNINEE